MRKPLHVLAVPALAASLVLTGCGSKTDSGSASGGSGASASSSSTSGDGSSAGSTGDTSDAAAQCPTKATQHFAKARFAVNLGLAAGTFHHWDYKPYKEGKFAKGQKGRTLALVKAGAAGLFAAKQLKDATTNVKADPTMCKAFIGPLTKAQDELTQLGSKVKSGDVSQIGATGSAVDGLLGTAKSKGVDVTEQDGLS